MVWRKDSESHHSKKKLTSTSPRTFLSKEDGAACHSTAADSGNVCRSSSVVYLTAIMFLSKARHKKSTLLKHHGKVAAEKLLQDDMWDNIFEDLSLDDLLSCRLVCKAFQSKANYLLKKKDQLMIQSLDEQEMNFCFDEKHVIDEKNNLKYGKVVSLGQTFEKLGHLMPNIKVLHVNICGPKLVKFPLSRVVNNFPMLTCIVLKGMDLDYDDTSYPLITHFLSYNLWKPNICMPAIESLEGETIDDEDIHFKIPDSCKRLVVSNFGGSTLRWQELPLSIQVLHVYQMSFEGYQRRFEPIFFSIRDVFVQMSFYRHEASQLIDFFTDHRMSLRKLEFQDGFHEEKIRDLGPALTHVEELKMKLTSCEEVRALRESIETHAIKLKKLSINASLNCYNSWSITESFLTFLPRLTSSLKLEVYGTTTCTPAMIATFVDIVSDKNIKQVLMRIKCKFSGQSLLNPRVIGSRYPDFTFDVKHKRDVIIDISNIPESRYVPWFPVQVCQP